MRKAIVIVLDSFGIGSSKDANKYGDAGANTFLHIAQACADGHCEEGRTGRLHLPNMQRLGLIQAAHKTCNIHAPTREESIAPIGIYGAAAPMSSGKDTTSGHWEIMGAPVFFDWGYFPDIENCFPDSFLSRFINNTGISGTLANCHASGTRVIQQFGEEHLQTGKPICYTSADSVFQIACHEALFSSEELDNLCREAQRGLNALNIARVIARPFTGDKYKGFIRTANRRDFSVPPHRSTFLDHMISGGKQVISVGKIADIFAGKGITQSLKGVGMNALIENTIKAFKACTQDTLIFTNLVDFDTCFGHRRDICGYARELELFDALLPQIINSLGENDLLLLTADHGCDPSWPGTNHTREYVPILGFGKSFRTTNIGIRDTFADIGQSLASFFELAPINHGSSFLKQPSRIGKRL